MFIANDVKFCCSVLSEIGSTKSKCSICLFQSFNLDPVGIPDTKENGP